MGVMPLCPYPLMLQQPINVMHTMHVWARFSHLHIIDVLIVGEASALSD